MWEHTRLVHNSFEPFAEAIKGWQVDFRQLCNAPFVSILRQAESKNILVTSAAFSSRLEQRGEAPKDHWTFAILQHNSPEIVWRGKRFTDQIAVYRPNSEIEAYSPSGFNVLTLSVPGSQIESWSKIYNVQICKLLSRMGDMLSVSATSAVCIKNQTETLLAGYAPTETSDQIADNLLADLQSAIWDASPYRKKERIHDKYKTFKRLILFIEHRLGGKIGLGDLCMTEKISPRTVQRLFHQYAGVSPVLYIRSRKLNCVRKDLLNNKNDMLSISDIANNWGFWHMGQFALDYRKLFAELPSETLKRR